MKENLYFELSKLGKTPDGIMSVMINNGQNGTGIRMGMPGITPRVQYHGKERDREVKVMFPFPPAKELNPNYVITINKLHLTPLRTCFIDAHKFHTITEFDHSKIKDVNAHIDQLGPITFHIGAYSTKGEYLGYSSSIYMLRFIAGLKEMIKNTYRYNDLVYVSVADGFMARHYSEFGYYITFLPLHNCLPIFNPKRVDGMAMCINIIQRTNSEITGPLSTVAKAALILSNYEDNVFIVDGVRLHDITPISDKFIKRIGNIINLNLRGKTKNKSKEKSNEAKWVDFAKYVDCATIQEGADISDLSNISSTGGTYYYTTISSSTAYTS